MDESPFPDAMKEIARPQGGAGRGKNMANIIKALKQQEGASRASTGVPPRKLPKHRRRLNDLNDLDETDSDSEEYKPNESEEDAEEDSQSSDYVPSESEFRTRRTGGGHRKALARSQSDEDFVTSGSGDSYTSSRRRKRNRKEMSGRRAQWHSDSESEEKFEEDDTYSDDSKGKMKVKRQRDQVSSDKTNDEDDEGTDLNAVDGSADGPKTRTGSVDSDSDVFEPDEEMDDDDDNDEEGGASSDAAGSAGHEENNMEKNVMKPEEGGHDLDLEPKLEKPKLEEEQDSTQVPAGNAKDNGISTPQANSAPTPNIPSMASPPNVNVQDAEVKPSVSDLKPPTAQATSGLVPDTDMEDKLVIVVTEESESNLYFGPSVTASSGAELSANTPVLIPTTVNPHGITLDTSDSSYATAERRVNVGVTPVVTNPYANPSVVPQIRSYCAGQQTALPYAVANPYVIVLSKCIFISHGPAVCGPSLHWLHTWSSAKPLWSAI
ncbi:hypothetical protein KIN20_038169 [Parelaphostrongylus tenuis]|uniref:Uncharacterized protein n=1 Tax=Parelaphostrongylus tenuis TaxID=148309 RepID=A0AAD5WLE5_PARTN|nr:hypothetical protein KIN20_038169 [Parelaphostrongylus tenuis]